MPITSPEDVLIQKSSRDFPRLLWLNLRVRRERKSRRQIAPLYHRRVRRVIQKWKQTLIGWTNGRRWVGGEAAVALQICRSLFNPLSAATLYASAKVGKLKTLLIKKSTVPLNAITACPMWISSVAPDPIACTPRIWWFS